MNSTANITDLDAMDSVHDGMGIAIFVFSCIITFIALCLNLLIVTALIRSKELRQRRYLALVLCLGFGDGLVSIASIIWLVNQNIGAGSSIPCGVSICFLTVGIFMSVYVTFIICLNRYLTTSRSHFADLLYGTYRKYLLIFFPSAAITAVNMVSSLLWKKRIRSCSVTNLMGEQMPVYSIFVTVIYLPILLATVVLYILTIRVIIRQFSKIEAPKGNIIFVVPKQNIEQFTLPNNSRKRKTTVVKTVGLILVCLLFLTTPLVLSFLLMLLNVPVSQTARIILTWGVVINSAVNPIIYASSIEEIRKNLRKMVFCFFKKE